MTIKTAVARAQLLNSNEGIILPGTKVLDLSPSWVFHWNDGGCHSQGITRDMAPEQRNAFWRSQATDHPNGRPLTPSRTRLDHVLGILPPFTPTAQPQAQQAGCAGCPGK
jgi:hypothetical protein